MKVKDVVILKDVAEDMNDSKDFYDQKNQVLAIIFGTAYLPISNLL